MTKIEVAQMDLLIKPRMCVDEAKALAAQIQSHDLALNAPRESRKYNAVMTAGAGAAMSFPPVRTSGGTATKLLESLLRRV